MIAFNRMIRAAKLSLLAACVTVLWGGEPAFAADKTLKLADVPTSRSAKPQSETSKKHRIRQRAFLHVDGRDLKIHLEIQNKDWTRGRTMCSKVAVIDDGGYVVGAVAVRAGIKRRGNHTRYRRIDRKITIPEWVDTARLNVEVTDWYCSKGFGSRLGATFKKATIRPITGVLEGGIEVLSIVGSIKDKALAELSYSMRKIGGKGWQKTFDDVASLTRIIDDKTAVQAISGIKRFVETGSIQHLNPVAVFVAAQMSSARAELYRKAMPVPTSMLDLLPAKIRSKVSSARYIEKKQVPEIALPHFALSDARAVVVEDTIVFRDGQVPSTKTEEGKYLWLHEMFHVYQYKTIGTTEFSRQYLSNEFGFQSADAEYPGVNPLERDADLFACDFVANVRPSYIGKCP